MGRRSGGGGRSATEILRRRIESCGNKYSTVEDLVDYLQSNYPDYRRTKQQPFARLVKQALESSPSRPKKSIKRSQESEERLTRLENKHVKRRRQIDHGRPSASSLSSSEEEEEEEEEEDEAVLTSEDAINGEEVEPEFDLMKLILRESYSESKNTKLKNEEKNVEIEVSPRKIEMMNAESGDVEMKKESVKVSGSGGVEFKGKDGPRFRDLGGMDSVLEELKMEVIVPLYHPQLPRWLGVRPMAGILLHGPPGCGKTKLAHAIANETGVPFYKISATEVVSGVSGNGFLYCACGLLAISIVVDNMINV